MHIEFNPFLLRHGRPVRKGALLASKRIDGRLPPAGPGSSVTPDGTGLVATTAGLALVSDTGAMVIPAEVVYEDVASRVHYRAAGNLVICGDVLPGARVESGGAVGILGAVRGATVQASGSVAVAEGCTQAIITAGTSPQVCEQTVRKLSLLQASFSRLLAALDQLQAMPSFKMVDLQMGLGPLLQVLVERSFDSLPGQLTEAVRRCSVHGNLAEVQELRSLLELRFAGEAIFGCTRSDLDNAYRSLYSTILRLQDPDAGGGVVVIFKGAVGSEITAGGRVAIMEGDSRRCRIETRTCVQVEGSIVGGLVAAGTEIRALRVEDGAVLMLLQPGKIHAEKLEAGTTIRRGKSSIQLQSDMPGDWIAMEGEGLEIWRGIGRNEL